MRAYLLAFFRRDDVKDVLSLDAEQHAELLEQTAAWLDAATLELPAPQMEPAVKVSPERRGSA